MLLKRKNFILSSAFLMLFFSLNAVGQAGRDTYKASWKRVDSFMDKGLTTSALNEVDHVFQMAKEDRNAPQIIKSLLYKNHLSQNLTEDATIRMIDTMRRETGLSAGATKSVLQNITAGLYQNYLAYNRYRLYGVSNTSGFVKDDIATWSINDLQENISALYDSSLRGEALKKIPLEEFDVVVERGNTRYLRPTLFDLLAHNALNYFKSTEPGISRPSFGFEIADTSAFAPSKIFTRLIFKTKDSGSHVLKALKIFQELEKLHQNDVHALMDVVLERLDFVLQHSILPDRDDLYLTALGNLYQDYHDGSAAQAGFLKAARIYGLSPKDAPQSGKYKVIDAVSLLEAVRSGYPESEGGINAANLLTDIRQPSLSLEVEKVNVIGKPFRSLVFYRNTDSIYLRIVSLSDKRRETFRNTDDDKARFQKIAGMKPLKEWTQPLPAERDFLNHRVEIKIDALPTGSYAILASREKNFKADKKNILAAVLTSVSDISFINNGRQYLVLDRNSGYPIKDATVKILRSVYDYKNRKYELIPYMDTTTDQHGAFKIPQDSFSVRYGVRLDIRTPADRLFLDDEQRMYYYNENTKTNTPANQPEIDARDARIFFFTDRSIYRPGQKVYYKGIGITKGWESGKSQLLKSDSAISVFLINANGERIDSSKTLLNDFGSFHGEFDLPAGQLTGNYRVVSGRIPSEGAVFSVEEYKRPKFYTEIARVQDGYRVNDTVLVAGKAEAYAGNPVDGATVKYRVVRKTRFLYPWLFWRMPMPNVSPMEITHGEAVTDEKGNFEIRFKAIPDRQTDAVTEPVFDYEVMADVTDINGETRSAIAVVPVGYKTLDLKLDMEDRAVFLSGRLKSVIVSVKNLSGEPQSASVQMVISKLQLPTRLLRPRLWQRPDTFVLSKTEYEKFFPHDVYKDEDMPETWQATEVVLKTRDSINGSLDIALKKELAGGWYKAEATSIGRSGDTVRDIKYFQILQPDQGNPHNGSGIESVLDKKGYAPGDTAHMYLSATRDAYLIQQTESEKDTIIRYGIPVGERDGREMSFVVGDEDRGGFYVTSLFVKDNRFYSSQSFVDVPWNNKKLHISTETFRDKTLPGSRETYTIKITSVNGQRVYAEMLAAMYDASLDQFRTHSWQNMNLWPSFYASSGWTGHQNFVSVGSSAYTAPITLLPQKEKVYDQFILASPSFQRLSFFRNGEIMKKSSSPQMITASTISLTDNKESDPDAEAASEIKTADPGTQNAIRTNFNETAFFFPELRTDKNGLISLSFTMPDALTRWKMMLQAHTRDLATGYMEKSVVTQKDLMIVPDPPRFFRQGDRAEFSAKVVNTTDRALPVKVKLRLRNATDMSPVDDLFINDTSGKTLVVPGNQSQSLTFSLQVPKGFNDWIIYRVTAAASNVSDGEEAFIPVVSNRMLVTESLPLEMRGTGTKSFTFQHLLSGGKSSSLENFGITVQYAANPVWYALQALPYLNENTRENAEEAFNRYFSNALAATILNIKPELRSVFEKWRVTDTSALRSMLRKNQELKSVLLQETPWVMNATSEEQQKKNIALLFDLVSLRQNLTAALYQIKKFQTTEGGFTWTKGGPDDRYMTQYILAGLGHLKKLKAWSKSDQQELSAITKRAVEYLDTRLVEDFKNAKKDEMSLTGDRLLPIQASYLYARSFFPDIPFSPDHDAAYRYYIGQAKKYWRHQGVYIQGLLSLALYRDGDEKTAVDIVRSLRENAITDTTQGMYWKAWDQRGWWWYQAPIEAQSLMIEVFDEVARDPNAVDLLKQWLLKNKQTNHWQTGKATSEAVYALLLRGEDWVLTDRSVQVRLGGTVFDNQNSGGEESSGYFERKISGDLIKPDMGRISVSITSTNKDAKQNIPSWGAVYWQYFEELDKITFAETPLQLSKKLFVEQNTDRGPVLYPVNEGDTLKTGDKIRVRITLQVDRDMDYVHMKDMRAATMEPVNVLSGYRWQNGLGYYESTGDVSTNFYFDHLRKGSYVFEYPMFVAMPGDYSNGITTIRCMYAPEFTAHSEGIRVVVK